MDRRDFLKTSGAAAVATGAVGTAALSADDVAALPAPAILSGSKRLLLASDVTASSFEPDRLARRIEAASNGHFRIEMSHDADGAELAYGRVSCHAGAHRGFSFFAGLPFAQGLSAPDQHAWLAVGGGQMLWDELAASFGFKPLLAGHTGPSGGVWATTRLERPADFAGLTVHAEPGLAADVLRALGAHPVAMEARGLGRGLADGDVRAAEWLGPIIGVSPGVQPLAQRLYEPGFHRGGMMLSLDVRKPLWESMSESERAIFEACATQEYHLSAAEARAHSLIAARVAAPAKWPVRLEFPDAVADALDQVCAEILEDFSATGAEARRIHDSYQAFRNLLGDDLVS